MKRSVGIILLLTFALCANAAELVNINTADSATLQTLPGIGPSKAQAIIDYRTQNGLFATKEDVQNVSGIGTATYNGIKDLITVGGSTQGTQTTQTQTNTGAQTSQNQSQTQTSVSVNGNAPPMITATIEASSKSVAGAGTFFEGRAYGTKGEPLIEGVRYMWNFGDGIVTEGKSVLHTYRYPGRYLVELNIAYNYSSAMTRLAVEAWTPSVMLVLEADNSLTVRNNSSGEIDIGLWSITDGRTRFVVPEHTVIFTGEGLRFAPAVLGFVGNTNATLLYPNGTQAAMVGVASNSPLRGERVVSAATRQVASQGSSAAASSLIPTAKAAGDGAALAAIEATGAPLWMFGVGLLALIVLGTAGMYYARAMQSNKETSDAAEGFTL